MQGCGATNQSEIAYHAKNLSRDASAGTEVHSTGAGGVLLQQRSYQDLVHCISRFRQKLHQSQSELASSALSCLSSRSDVCLQ